MEHLFIEEEDCGLRAVIALDDQAPSPAAGGVRIHTYPSLGAAAADATELARAMTMKCALAGLAAGGGKAVVMELPGMDRQRALLRLGEHIEALGGRFWTAGDLGTTAGDLATLARATRYVRTDSDVLADAVGRGLVACLEAACAHRQRALPELTVPELTVPELTVPELTVSVQGCGDIGAAVARRLAAAGAKVRVSDLAVRRAESVARAVGGSVLPPEQALTAEVDVVAPCAAGHVLTTAVARSMAAWAVCGAANHVLSGPEVAAVLAERRIVHVPDVIASAGAVVWGIAQSVMGIADPGPMVDALGRVALEVLHEAASTGDTPQAVAERRAVRLAGLDPRRRSRRGTR